MRVDLALLFRCNAVTLMRNGQQNWFARCNGYSETFYSKNGTGAHECKDREHTLSEEWRENSNKTKQNSR